MKRLPFNLPWLLIALAGIAALFAAGLHLTRIDTDIIRFLPHNDRILEDAAGIFVNHPMQGEMLVDLGVPDPDPERLLQHGRWVEEKLRQSGLFKQVGTEAMQALFPALIGRAVDALPVLFTADDLRTQVLPLISPPAIHSRLGDLQSQLLGMGTIGQAEYIARDPLELRNIILARLADLAPVKGVDLYKGQLLSADHRHLLIIATPAAAGTDTAFARRLDQLMHALAEDRALQGTTVTPMGAYRAALDNELIARQDVQKAIVFSTLGIALLLLLTFPRPLLGLFAFLPAVAGTVTAYFSLALMHDSVSVLALGFGGAIISFTVDHGIAYLLFLDQSTATSGKSTAREIWAVGLTAALTTIGAFSALNLTGFPILEQLGQFAAIGVAASFLFVHLVFPKIFPHMPPARRRALPLRRLMARLPKAGKYPALAAFSFMGVMLFFAKPVFNVDLRSMNTVSRETAAAENLLTGVWGGGIFDKLYLMNQAGSQEELQSQGDRLLELMAQDVEAARLGGGFLPSVLFPGAQRRQENFAAWRAFWDAQKIDQVRKGLAEAVQMGFNPDAFAPFLDRLDSPQPPALDPGVPEPFQHMLGIVHKADGSWMQFATWSPGPQYQAEVFYGRYGAAAKVFDPTFFAQHLGDLLLHTFVKMLAVVGASVALLVFFFSLDLKLTAITLTPVLFALISTLGTLRLTGHPLDIPALMLGIIVIGMGVDYALYSVRGYQRYDGMQDPRYQHIHMTVIMAALSTLIGFGVLLTAKHALLYSAGITSFLGISFALIGAFVILPPLLNRYFARPMPAAGTLPTDDVRGRAAARYRRLEVHPRLFARSKLRWDVMFDELPQFVDGRQPLRTILDIGCGYAVPACWMIERFPAARIYAIDPDPERVRVAARVLDSHGSVRCDRAPNLPEAPQPADAALLLDMIHFLDDHELQLTFQRLHANLQEAALMIIRAVVPPPGRPSLHWRIDALRMRMKGLRGYHRPAETVAARAEENGFQVQQITPSGGNPELAWVIATRRDARSIQQGSSSDGG